MFLNASDPLVQSRVCVFPQAETELRITQSEFDRQAEITRLLLEGVSSTHVRKTSLTVFVSASLCELLLNLLLSLFRRITCAV